MLHTLKIFFSTVLVLLVVWDWIPSRNIYGTPEFETLKKECSLSSGEKIRLYEGNGGATSAYWYTVTFEAIGSWGEKQVIYAYAYPTIESLECSGQEIFIDPVAGKQIFSRDELIGLLAQPLLFYREKQKPVPTFFEMYTGRLVLVVIVGLLLSIIWRKKLMGVRND